MIVSSASSDDDGECSRSSTANGSLRSSNSLLSSRQSVDGPHSSHSQKSSPFGWSLVFKDPALEKEFHPYRVCLVMVFF